MKKLLIIVIALTLSSCFVSQKTFDEKCCKIEAQIQDLEDKAKGMDLKEQLLREAIHDLQTDTILPPHDPANN